MGIMTGGGVAVCGGVSGPANNVARAASKKCEVKLERLNHDNSCSSSVSSSDCSKFKRPFDNDSNNDDLRPPVKLKVKINGNHIGAAQSTNASNSSTSNNNLTNSNTVKSQRRNYKDAAQSHQAARNPNTARGGGGLGANSGPMAVPPTLKKELPKYVPLPTPPTFEPGLDSKSLKEAISKLGYDASGKISTSIYVNRGANALESSIPDPPTRPNVALTEEELLPMTPCVYVRDKVEAFSPQLLDVCLRRPIVLVRNLAAACGMDLGLYTTKTLVETHPNHPVEIRSQMEQTSDENWSPNMEEPVWYCTSSRAHTTIAKYAEYQAESIKEYIEKTVNNSALKFTTRLI